MQKPPSAGSVALSLAVLGVACQNNSSSAPPGASAPTAPTAPASVPAVATGACSTVAPPALHCGKPGGNPTFANGAGCWLPPCSPKLTQFEGALTLLDAAGEPVPGTMTHDDYSMAFTSTAPLKSGVKYALVFDPSKAAVADKQAITMDDGDLTAAKYRFCFDPAESAQIRNGSKASGCK